MSNFKPKITKKIIVDKTNESLDCKHKKFLKEFDNEQNVQLPKLLNERSSLLDIFRSNKKNFEEQLEIKEKILYLFKII